MDADVCAPILSVGHGILVSMIWPARGVTAAHLADVLNRTHDMSQNVLSTANDRRGQVDAYLNWVNDAVRMVRHVLRQEDVERLLLTRRYWATMANPEVTPALLRAVHHEVDDRQADIAKARDEAAALSDHWAPHGNDSRVVVPDTGVFLNHRTGTGLGDVATINWSALGSVRTFDDVRVVVPILVVDELESLKDKRKDDIGKQARRAVNQLFDWFESRPSSWRVVKSRTAKSGGVTIELLPDERGHVRLPRNDDELVDRTVVLKDLQAAPVHFLSYDSGAVLRAKLAGLQAHRIRSNPLP